MRFINLTPHAIMLNDGTTFQPSGIVARVQAGFTAFNSDGICSQQFGDVQDLPEPVEDTIYIVSAMVLASCLRSDVVAPATGHPDVIRNASGQIVSVPGFVR